MKNREFIVPDDIRRFIVSSISSIPYLEAMLLFRNAPERDWNAYEVAERLYMSVKSASELIHQLQHAQIVAMSERDGAYRYRPGRETTKALIDKLAVIYASHLVPITHLIHSATSGQPPVFREGLRRRRE